MAMKSVAARLRDQIRHFAASREGNIAVLFALASLPLVGLMGAAVDYSRANAVKADLQSALDATALMVSKSASTMTKDQLQAAAKKYFEALFKNGEANSTTITATYMADSSTVTLDGTTNVKSDFIGMVVPKFANIPVNGAASVSWGTSKLRVALALDNTGSMASSGKMDSLKTASHNLLKQLQTAAQKDGDVRVAIVPFATGVNVSKDNKDATWLDWSLYNDDGGSGWSGSGSGGGDWGDGGDGGWGGGGSGINKNNWQGCVTDRDQDYDVKNTTPTTSTKATLFRAFYDKNCPVPLMALSTDWSALNKRIDEMKPNGATNQTIGLAWAWQALTQGVPLSAPAPEKDVNQVVILLTDGLNTQNRWTTDVAKIDERTAKACANIKAAGVTLYTVQVKGNGDPTSAILQKCATDSNKFFALDSANQMVTTFNTIGTNLSQLRIAK